MAVARFVEANRHEVMNQENWRQIRLWLSLIPRRLIESLPELLMLEAWMLQQQWRNTDLPACLDRIEALMAQAAEACQLGVLQYRQRHHAATAGAQVLIPL